MALDRIWQLFPAAVGVDDDYNVGTWLQYGVSSDLVVTERQRTIVRAYFRGRALSFSVTEPVASTVVRIRYRNDLTYRGWFIDPTGQIWVIDGWQEVGRGQYLDVKVTSYALTPIITPPLDTFAPPPLPDGWHLQDADGNPLQLFDGATVRSFSNTLGYVIAIKLQVDEGWQIAPGEAFDPLATFPGEHADGTDLTVRFYPGSTAANVNDLTDITGSTLRWPANSAQLQIVDSVKEEANFDVSVYGLRIGRRSA